MEGFLYPSTPRQRHRPLRTPGHVQLLRGGTWIRTMGTSRWDPDDLPTAGQTMLPTWDFEALIFGSCFGSLMQPSQFFEGTKKGKQCGRMRHSMKYQSSVFWKKMMKMTVGVSGTSQQVPPGESCEAICSGDVEPCRAKLDGLFFLKIRRWNLDPNEKC